MTDFLDFDALTTQAPPREPAPNMGPLNHTFRVLRQPGEVIQPAEPPIFYDPIAGRSYTLLSRLGRFVHARLYNSLMFLTYMTFTTLGRFMPWRRRRAPGGPLRVLRIVSKISQGGVAKVALQTILKTPPERVETYLLVFDEKHAVTRSLQERPDIRLINRKLLLLSTAHRFRVFRHMAKLARIIWRVNPDLIHMHEPQCSPVIRAAAGLAGGYRLVVHLHNDYKVRQRSIQKFHDWLKRHALRRSNLIACSQTIHDAAYNWLGETRYPVALIEDGTDDLPDQPPDPQLAEALARATAGRRIIAKMAHLMPHKRIPDFLMACRILLDEGYPIFALLMCYGKERFAWQMREQFCRLFAPEEGEFLFMVRAPQHILNQVEIGVSTSALEGLGLNVLEYQIEGVPVVCTDLIPHREMVTDEVDGLLYETGNVAQLVRQLRRLLDDAELRERLAQTGQLRARRRHWSDTGANMARFYEQVVRRPA